MHCIIMMTWCMQMKVVTTVEERRRILRSCHSDPTSGLGSRVGAITQGQGNHS